MQLRDYQSEAIEATYAWFNSGGGNPLVIAPTGAGKSVILSEFIRRAITDYPGTRIVLATHQKELIQQDYQALMRLWPEAPAGIYSAGLNSRRADRAVTFAGIQTVAKRAGEFGYVDILIVDECHLIPRSGSTQYQKFIAGLKEVNPALKVMGLTATPFRLDSGRLDAGPGAIFDGIAYDIPIPMLVERGYLAPLVSKAPGMTFDTSGIRTRGGDWIEGEMDARFNTDSVTRDAVAEICHLGQDRRSWLLFCISVDHAANVRDAIRSHGITAEMVTGKTPAQERARILKDFKDGRLRAITNVNVLCLDEETEILTSEGFVGIDEMTMGHHLAAWRRDGGVEWTHPELITRRGIRPGEKMVSLGGSIAAPIRVTENHRMVVRSGKNRSQINVTSAGSLVGKSFCIPAFGNCEPEVCPDIDIPKGRSYSAARVRANSYTYRKKGMSKDDARAQAERLEMSLCGRVHKRPEELTLSECALIGFWLGDGSRSNDRVVISQSKKYLDNIKWFDGILKSCGLRHSRNLRKKNGNLSNDVVIWSLARGTGGGSQSSESGWQKIDLYLNKNGSSLLRYLSKEQIEALLDGLWRADGNHHSSNKPKHRYVCGTQRLLYDLLQSICVVRGISASIGPEIPPRKKHHSPQWRFSWGGRQNWCYTNQSSSFDTWSEDERVWCVTSSTSFLICRRKGKVFVTGNTTGFDAPATDLLAFLRPTQSLGLYMQMAGRAMRTAPGKENGLVLDYAGNVQRHGPVDAVNVSDAGGRAKDPNAPPGEAPSKVCPKCSEIVFAGARECRCGFMFPEPDSEIERAASTAAIMNMTAEDDWRAVQDFAVFPHTKNGKTSLRVEYLIEGRAVKEWVCLEHTGFPRQQAVKWWHHNAGTTPPDTVQDALDRRAEIRVPAEAVVRREGKYDRIARVRGRAA